MNLEITVADHGPLRISGGSIVLKDATGKPFDLAGRAALSLCRCGHSSNKPFCDGAHAKVGFNSKVEARTLPPPKPVA